MPIFWHMKMLLDHTGLDQKPVKNIVDFSYYFSNVITLRPGIMCL